MTTSTLLTRLAAASEWCRGRPESRHVADVIDETIVELRRTDTARHNNAPRRPVLTAGQAPEVW